MSGVTYGEYMGWNLHLDTKREVWVASRHGVEMNAPNQSMIKAMINQKHSNEVNRRRGPAGWIP